MGILCSYQKEEHKGKLSFCLQCLSEKMIAVADVWLPFQWTLLQVSLKKALVKFSCLHKIFLRKKS